VQVLAEFGHEVAPDVTITVHDSTADCRFLVLPQRPPGAEGLDENALERLVSRDSMIGVAAAREPNEAL
jgi:nitrile hydratase